MAYVDRSEVKALLGTPQRHPSDAVLDAFITEAESRVTGTLGTLPTTRDEEIAGVIRDLAVSRALHMMRGGEGLREVTSLRDDALARLRDLDARTETPGGVGEVDAEAYANPPGTLFGLSDVFLRLNEEDIVP